VHNCRQPTQLQTKHKMGHPRIKRWLWTQQLIQIQPRTRQWLRTAQTLQPTRISQWIPPQIITRQSIRIVQTLRLTQTRQWLRTQLIKPSNLISLSTRHGSTLIARASDVFMQDINIVALRILVCQLATFAMLNRQYTQTLLVALFLHSVHSGLMV